MKSPLKVAEVCRALNEREAKYLVIGGIACILHGYIRATTDVDILVERSPQNIERVLAALATTGYGFAAEWTVEEILKRPVTIIGDDPAVDIFLVAWSVKYDQAAADAWVAEIEGVKVPVIGIDHLIASKRTGRPLDTADIEALEKIRRIRHQTG